MVSVIIPVYNGVHFLEDCLRSVMNQTYQDYEIIVIDDGSTDDTWKICQRLAQEDDRILPFHQENAGVSAARNKGIAVAQGEYIMFVDADDKLNTRAMELLVHDIKETGADMSIGAYEVFKANYRKTIACDNKRYSIEEVRNNICSFTELLQFVWGRIYRKETITVNNLLFLLGVSYGEDICFNVEYCNKAQKISVISESVYHYRLGGTASSLKYHENMAWLVCRQIDTYAEFLKVDSAMINKNFDRICASCLIDVICHHITYSPRKAALNHIANTLDLFKQYLSKETVMLELYGAKLTRAIMGKDTVGVYDGVYRIRLAQITKKKLKRICYSLSKDERG